MGSEERRLEKAQDILVKALRWTTPGTVPRSTCLDRVANRKISTVILRESAVVQNPAGQLPEDGIIGGQSLCRARNLTAFAVE